MGIAGTGDVDVNSHSTHYTRTRAGHGLRKGYNPGTLAEVTALLGYTPDYCWNMQQGASPLTDSGGTSKSLSTIVTPTSFTKVTPWPSVVSVHTEGAQWIGLASDNSVPNYADGSFMFVTKAYSGAPSGARIWWVQYTTYGIYVQQTATGNWTFAAKDSGARTVTVTTTTVRSPGWVAIAYGLDRSTNLAFITVKSNGHTQTVTADCSTITNVKEAAPYLLGCTGNSPLTHQSAMYVCLGDTGYQAASSGVVNRLL